MNIKRLLLGATLGLVILFSAGAVQAAPHSVALSWTASTSLTGTIPAGSGYNVYNAVGACPASGALVNPTKLTASPVTTVTYTDNTPVGGTTYCYLVTAILNGNENPVAVVAGNTNFIAATVPIDPPTNLNITGQQ
jgi:hypothetical protein